MDILLVEDDENKKTQVVNILGKNFKDLNILLAKSYQSGLKLILNQKFKLIILDMSIPTFDIGINEDGGRPQPYGGREILRQMDRRRIFIPVIVLTQFDRFGEGADTLTLEQLDKQLWASHFNNYRGLVQYNVLLVGWKEQLLKLVNKSLGREEAK